MNFFLIVTMLLFSSTHLYADQSIILESDGYACMGDDKSRKQTEDVAIKDAKRKGSESAITYIQSETHVNDAVLEKDLLSAYSKSQVKVLQDLLKEWYKDSALGDCYRVKLKVEVIPDEVIMKSSKSTKKSDQIDDPSAPLSVRVWSDKSSYTKGERIRVFVKGNRPFYGKVVYQEASGALVQILPNPHRKSNYFNGGTVYEIPSADDRFDLEVAPPFGVERITLYASTTPMGDLPVTATGGVYLVQAKPADMSTGTRGVKLIGTDSKRPAVAEFAEFSHEMTTGN